MSVLLLSTGLRIWPRPRATWKQGTALNLNPLLDWGQHVKIRFKYIQRKRQHWSKASSWVTPFQWDSCLTLAGCCCESMGFLKRSAVCSVSDFTQKGADHSFMMVYSLGVQTTWVVLTHLSGWWGLNTQTHPDCWCSPTFVLYCKAFGPSAKDQKAALSLSCSEEWRVSESTLSISALKSFQVRMISAWGKLKQKEHWVWAMQRVAPLFVILWPRQHQLWTLTVLWCNTN